MLTQLYDSTTGKYYLGLISPDELDATVSDAVDKHVVVSITTAADTWEITHNLNKKPAVQIFDESNEEIEALITHVSNNEVKIEFNADTVGKVVFN